MFNILVRLFLFLSLTVVVQDRVNGDENVALTGLMILSAASFFIKPKRRVEIKYLIAPFFFALITLFLSKYVVVMASALKVFAALCAIKAIGENFDMNLKTVGLWMIGFILISLSFVGWQYTGQEPFFFPAFQEVAGMSFRPWILGCSVVLAIPFLVAIHPALFFLAFPLLWVSHSTVCMITGILAAGIVLIQRRKQISNLWFFLAIPALILFSQTDKFDHNRIEVWVNSFKHLENIWIGRGLGAWAHSAFIHQATKPDGEILVWLWAHNEFYQYLFEQGIFGLSLLLVSVFFIFKSATSSVTRSALLSLVMLSMVHPVFHWGKVSVFAILIISIAIAEGSERSSENERLVGS